ncbi:MAG: IS66 family insertion sequence element accessory protein TnpB, partial [Rhodobacter sp.]|nr:IS66 family insertion sequence element accessory protein TnpB [Rhodobacter sp.]
MFRLDADLRVYLHREPIDFRAGITRLAVLIQEEMRLDPFARLCGILCPGAFCYAIGKRSSNMMA